MANNFFVKDAGAVNTEIKSTDNSGVHTPHHNIDILAANASVDIGSRADVAWTGTGNASLIALGKAQSGNVAVLATGITNTAAQVALGTVQTTNVAAQVALGTAQTTNVAAQIALNTAQVTNVAAQIAAGSSANVAAQAANTAAQVALGTAQTTNVSTQLVLNRAQTTNVAAQVALNTTQVTNAATTTANVAAQVALGTAQTTNVAAQVALGTAQVTNTAAQTANVAALLGPVNDSAWASGNGSINGLLKTVAQAASSNAAANVGISQIGNNNISTGNGLSTNATIRVAVASDQTPFGVKLAQDEYKIVGQSQTAITLGTTGAANDYIASVLIVPGNTSPGAVTLLDNNSSISIVLFAGGANSISTLHPFTASLGMKSVTGPWKITTGANVTALAIGDFT